jgi:hypothetical protein
MKPSKEAISTQRVSKNQGMTSVLAEKCESASICAVMLSAARAPGFPPQHAKTARAGDPGFGRGVESLS